MKMLKVLMVDYYRGKAKVYLKMSEHWFYKGKIEKSNEALEKASESAIKMASVIKEVYR